MRHTFRALPLFVLLLSPIACAHSADSPMTSAPKVAQASPVKVAETKMVLRDLWLGHVLSIRNVAVGDDG